MCALFCRYTACQAFLSTLNETNDYAGQHEVISETMTSQITVELARYVQELKQERKSVIKFVFFFLRDGPEVLGISLGTVELSRIM